MLSACNTVKENQSHCNSPTPYLLHLPFSSCTYRDQEKAMAKMSCQIMSCFNYTLFSGNECCDDSHNVAVHNISAAILINLTMNVSLISVSHHSEELVWVSSFTTFPQPVWEGNSVTHTQCPIYILDNTKLNER